MNVWNADGRHGLSTGGNGLDLVDAGMVLHAGPQGYSAPAAHEPSHRQPQYLKSRPACERSMDPRSAQAGASRKGFLDSPSPSAGTRASLEAWSPPASTANPGRDSCAATTFLLARLDRHGLWGAVVAPAEAADSILALDAAARAPDRLRGVIPLPEAGLPSNLSTLVQHGLAGISIREWDAMPDPEGWRPLLMRLAAHGLHLQLNVSPACWVALLPSVLGHGVPVRLELPSHSDDLTGGRAAFAALERHADHPDLWIGFSPAAVQAHGLAGAFERLLAAAGPTRFLWGSGAEAGQGPWGLDDQIMALLDLLPRADARHAVCGANARWLAFGSEVAGHAEG